MDWAIESPYRFEFVPSTTYANMWTPTIPIIEHYFDNLIASFSPEFAFVSAIILNSSYSKPQEYDVEVERKRWRYGRSRSNQGEERSARGWVGGKNYTIDPSTHS